MSSDMKFGRCKLEVYCLLFDLEDSEGCCFWNFSLHTLRQVKWQSMGLQLSKSGSAPPDNAPLGQAWMQMLQPSQRSASNGLSGFSGASVIIIDR